MYEHLMVVVIFSKRLIQPTEQITLNIVLYVRCTINYVILFITDWPPNPSGDAKHYTSKQQTTI